jgi:general secretion pathway protein E
VSEGARDGAIAADDMVCLDAATIALARQRAGAIGVSVFEAAQHVSGLTGRPFVRALAAALGLPVLETAHMAALLPVFEKVSLPQALQRDCVLMRDAQHGLVGVLHDPFDPVMRDWLGARAVTPLSFALALRADIHAYLAQQEQSVRAIDSVAHGARDPIAVGNELQKLSFKTISADTNPVVKLVNSTIYDALKEGASDIHLRRTATGVQIKYRVDGVLMAIRHIEGVEMADQVVSRIKVLAELDISEHRVPQDGKFQVVYESRTVDLRVSVMPTIHGEACVLRLLDKHTVVGADGQLHLDDLGFDASTLKALRFLVNQPYGMLLVTGPTGSGKTTTLYAAISEVNRGRDNFLTIEDPVEYELDDVEQIPVNEKQGLTFARGLRSILRHDPDKIMVGEIRDRETAEMAIQAALTGHTVYSTLHANNAFDVFNRLSYMDIDPYALTSALNGIWAQRLLRTNCTHCAVAYVPDETELTAAGLRPAQATEFKFMRGTGCGDCKGTGYRGRKAIAEVMVMTDALRELIATKAPVSQIKAQATASGTRYLREVALDMAAKGLTTLEEVARVTVAG